MKTSSSSNQERSDDTDTKVLKAPAEQIYEIRHDTAYVA